MKSPAASIRSSSDVDNDIERIDEVGLPASSRTLTPNGDFSDADERTSLLKQDASNGTTYATVDRVEDGVAQDETIGDVSPDDHEGIPPGTWPIIALLFIGVFVSAVDNTIIIAIATQIASSFSAFGSSPWINTSFILMATSVQPILGKLSDIYGRKKILLVSYGIFAIGTSSLGLAQTMWQLILGRLVAGLGAGGMAVTVTIIITDLVPLRHVASVRSYVNIIQTLGRFTGAPLGGFLSDQIGWRWCFSAQAPFLAVAIILVSWKLPGTTRTSSPKEHDLERREKLARVDFVGAILLFTSLVAFLSAFALGGQALAWNDGRVIGLLVGSVLLLAVFTFYELRYAVEPIFPPALAIRRSVLLANTLNLLLNFSQLSMALTIPLYFLVTAHASNTTASLHIVPISAAHVVGSLLVGWEIRRTGRYKRLIVSGCVLASVSYALMVLRWRGHTGWAESLYIFPSGFGASMVFSSTYIALTNSVRKDELAMATGSAYVSMGIGLMTGISVTQSVQHGSLRRILESRLHGVEGSRIIESVITNVNNVWTLEGRTREIVIQAYIKSLEYSHVVSLSSALLALLLSGLIREEKVR